MRTQPSTIIALVLLAIAPLSGHAQAVRNGWPAVSPDGERIAFVSNRDGMENVYVIQVDGRGERRVSRRGGRLPQWARGDTDLLFTGTEADSNKIFSIPPDASVPRLVTTVVGRSPVLSPDRSRVLYSLGPWSATELIVDPVAGGEMRRVAGGRSGGTVLKAWNGAWSPDGKQIAYAFGDTTRVLTIHIVNADGSGDHAVATITAQYGSAQMPAWSPDGSRLAFQVNGGKGQPAHIWLAYTKSGEAWQLNTHTDPYVDEVPAWFPDGRRLAFQSDRSGSMQVWVMNDDGSEAKQVTGR